MALRECWAIPARAPTTPCSRMRMVIQIPRPADTPPSPRSTASKPFLPSWWMLQHKARMRNWKRRSRMSTEPSPTRARVSLRLLTGVTLTVLGVLSACGEKVNEPPPVGGPPLVRRLTESQYRATVADVFGSDVPITARFERGLREEGLLAIGTSEAGI